MIGILFVAAAVAVFLASTSGSKPSGQSSLRDLTIVDPSEITGGLGTRVPGKEIVVRGVGSFQTPTEEETAAIREGSHIILLARTSAPTLAQVTYFSVEGVVGVTGPGLPLGVDVRSIRNLQGQTSVSRLGSKIVVDRHMVLAVSPLLF